MSKDDVDYNINNYSETELLLILGLTENDIRDTELINSKIDAFIEKFKREKNDVLIKFFNDVKNKFEEYEQTNEWFENIYTTQSNSIEENKITNRYNNLEIYNNNHFPMKKKVLGISNNYEVSVTQDKLNPNLTNITSRLINIDSQFREPNTKFTSSDYTLDLTDPLTNVVSLRLYSFQIPYTWYTIDYNLGNTCYWIQLEDYTIPITIEPGNYSQSTFIDKLNKSLLETGFSFPDTTPIDTPITYNIATGKIKLNMMNGIYTDPTGAISTISTSTKLIFYDLTNELVCNKTCYSQSRHINETLGWIMGFRNESIYIDLSGNIAEGVMILNGPRYIIIVIDDYNQNHINNSLVGITELSKNLKLPNYYSNDIPYICNDTNTDSSLNNLKIIQQYIPSAPRTLTQPQLYTINEILKNNDKTRTKNYVKSPVSTDTFALIPTKSNITFGSIYSEISGSLQDNKRVYFGPVNIDRMRIRLLDDKGNILNLNGADWSITLISENLYQY